MEQEIYFKVESYIRKLFAESDTTKLPYHNIDHTLNVVEKANEIATYYNLIENDKLIVCIAAWFHDTGYLNGPPDEHEERSVVIMKAFLKDEIENEATIRAIEDCIINTKQPSKPSNLLQEIIVDADTFNLGTKEFFEKTALLYKETSFCEQNLSWKDWNSKAIKFLDEHQYYTSYCREKLDERKKKNRKQLKREIGETMVSMPEGFDNKPLKLKTKTLKGVNGVLRLYLNHQRQMDVLAESKAIRLFIVNLLAIAILLYFIYRSIDDKLYFVVPLILLLVSSLCTMILVVLAMKPKGIKGLIFDNEVAGLTENKTPLNITDLIPLDEDGKQIDEIINSSNSLYKSLVGDIYQYDKILASKNKLIRWAYSIFVVGIILFLVFILIDVIMIWMK